MSDLNPNCDGNHCRSATAPVRVFPLGSGSSLILCMACAAHENRYRFGRSKELGDSKAWPQVDWFKCEPYSPPAKE